MISRHDPSALGLGGPVVTDDIANADIGGPAVKGRCASPLDAVVSRYD